MLVLKEKLPDEGENNESKEGALVMAEEMEDVVTTEGSAYLTRRMTKDC